MVLAIDMGNTNIVVGCIEKGKILFVERLCTDLSKTELEYAIGIKTVLELYDIKDNEIDGAIISSVVPPLTTILQTAVNKIIGKVPMVVGPGIKTGLNILMDNPKAMGADLIVDSVAGINEYGAPLIIIDMGTATTVSVIDKDKNYIGGMIIPGLRVSLESLVSRTSQLPRIGLEAPAKTIGKNTVDCMKSGILFGNASMIDGLIDRIREEIGCEAKAVATGGLAKTVIPLCKHDIIADDELLLKGLYLIYRKHGKIKENRLFFLTKEEKTIINIIVGRGVQNRRSI